MTYLEIKHRWADVQSSQGYSYKYPDKVTDFIKKKCSRPAVYRWTVRSTTASLLALYVGETENLTRRLEQYRSPGPRQTTNLRLKAYFDEAVGRGERVEVQAFEFDPFEINKVSFSMDLLGHTHLRRMLENLVLVWLHADSTSGPPLILNQVFRQDQERTRKRADNAITALKELGLTEDQILRVTQAVVIRKRNV